MKTKLSCSKNWLKTVFSASEVLFCGKVCFYSRIPSILLSTPFVNVLMVWWSSSGSKCNFGLMLGKSDVALKDKKIVPMSREKMLCSCYVTFLKRSNFIF